VLILVVYFIMYFSIILHVSVLASYLTNYIYVYVPVQLLFVHANYSSCLYILNKNWICSKLFNYYLNGVCLIVIVQSIGYLLVKCHIEVRGNTTVWLNVCV